MWLARPHLKAESSKGGSTEGGNNLDMASRLMCKALAILRLHLSDFFDGRALGMDMGYNGIKWDPIKSSIHPGSEDNYM